MVSLPRLFSREPRITSTLHRHLAPDLRWETARMPFGVEKAALVAQFSATPKLSKSVTELVRELNRNGYFVVLSSACPDPAPLEWHGEAPSDVAVLRKPNIGYDFGSWAVALAEEPKLLGVDKLLIVNDSMLGPFWSLESVIRGFESSMGEAWGLTRTHQFEPHVQSFFMGFHRPVVASPVFHDFWSQVRVEADKGAVIRRYEMGLARALHVEGFVTAAHIDGAVAAGFGENPSLLGWRKLLELDVPLIKRELIVHPQFFVHGDRIPGILEREFQIDITEWL